jgi:hypothetical protein
MPPNWRPTLRCGMPISVKGDLSQGSVQPGKRHKSADPKNKNI